jgi:putative phosphoribosyl transferase
VHAPNDPTAARVPVAGTRAIFRDRGTAADALARSLTRFAAESDVMVIGLARGGVPIARHVASAIGASFSVLISRKIGVPGIEEVALGAIAEGMDDVVTDSVAWYIGVPSDVLERLAARERLELARRERLYRDGHPLPCVEGRTVILVDDGLATGATLRAAARAVRLRRPKRIIAAVPVASRLALDDLRGEVDEIVAVVVTDAFQTVSSSYESFAPVSDDDVLTALGRPARRVSEIVTDITHRITDAERTIEIPITDGCVVADLGTSLHLGSRGRGATLRERGALAILAHAGGSSRDSYRNRYMAGRLRLSGYATMRVDLLTPHEQELDARNGSMRFDVARIAARLTDVCDWAVRAGIYGARRTILIGSSTGAAAALATAAQRQANTFAVVARGGRVDLTGPRLARVRAPVLLIVGDADREAVRLNSDAMQALPRGAKLIRIPGAGQTFGEPGALGAVAEHTVKWLDRLSAKRSRRGLGSKRSAR